MRFTWDSISEEEKKNLPCFEGFLKKIEKECEEIISVSETVDDDLWSWHQDIVSDDLSSELHHIYHLQVNFFMIKAEHVHLKKQTEKRDILSELKKHENSLLLENRIRSWLSHTERGNISGQLMIVHSFKCNEETKLWLKNKKGFLDLEPFEDLAFYKDEECMMQLSVRDRAVL